MLSNQMPMSQKIRAIGAGVILVAGLVGFFLLNTIWGNKTDGRENQQKNNPDKKSVERVLKEKGPEKAYEYVKRQYAQGDPAKPHDLLHWLGGEIYSARGVAGVSICDDAFNWGCFHGFFGRALSGEGIPFIKKAEKVCNAMAQDVFHVSDCFHGMGHGILALEGYAYQNLVTTLDNCNTLTGDGSKNSCANGVFMEYNFGTMHSINSNTSSVRTFHPDKPLEPCDTVPVFFRSTCLATQTYWWKEVLNGDFAKIGGYCNALTMKEKRSCFSSLGVIFLSMYQNKLDDTGQSCSRFADHEGVGYCLEGAIQYLLAKNPEIINAMDLCAVLSWQERRQCVARSKDFSCKTLNRCE